MYTVNTTDCILLHSLASCSDNRLLQIYKLVLQVVMQRRDKFLWFTNQHYTEDSELSIIQCFSEYVSNLEFCFDILDGDNFIADK